MDEKFLIPDIRDGLSFIERSILYTIYKNAKNDFRKSASIVGNTLCDYAPFGDKLIYENIIRMTQNFKINKPLIDGTDNFGTLENPEAKPYRYTECKLSKIGKLMFTDINYNCIDFEDNFDKSKKQPVVLPAGYPALLCNGNEEILGFEESYVKQALIAYIKNPDITISELAKIIGVPIFPDNKLLILNNQDFYEYYETGKFDFKYRYPIKNITEEQEILTFKANNRVIINGEIKTANIKELIQGYVEHRRNVLKRIYIFKNESSPTNEELSKILLNDIDKKIK